MSTGADWFARRLAGTEGQAPRPVVQQRPAPTPYHPQVSPAQQMPQHGGHLSPEDMVVTGKENFRAILDEAARNGDNVSFTKLSRKWKGGEAMRTEGHLRCPHCDSLNIFTRSSIGVTNTQTGTRGHAKPRCFDCGWTPDGIQGDQANWAS